MKKRILIAGMIPHDAYRYLRVRFHVTWVRSSVPQERLRRSLGRYHGLLTLIGCPINRKVLASADCLECIANFGVGYDNIDLAAARNHGVVVTNTPDVLTDATADIAWALILACARRVPEGERMIRSNHFRGWHALMLLGRDLKGKTLGIYGFGRIGRAVARRAVGWDMKVLYHQRHPVPARVERELRARRVGFQGLLERSDVLSVSAPLTPSTRRRFTLREFRRMKKTAIFVNTARGALHDEKDLAKALRDGIIFSAGLDVYENEPRVDPSMRKLPNCVLLPHLGSGTVETRSRMALLAAKNLDRVLRGLHPLTPVPGSLTKPLRRVMLGR